jgi:hypothetical protein
MLHDMGGRNLLNFADFVHLQKVLNFADFDG